MEELRPRPGVQVVVYGIYRILRRADDRIDGEIDSGRVDLRQGPAQPVTFALSRTSRGIQADRHDGAEERLDREVEIAVGIEEIAGRLGECGSTGSSRAMGQVEVPAE